MKNKYILITSARNEEKFIEATIKSVLDQTIKPLKWIIVSDHSNDRTDEIISKYSGKDSFIQLIKLEGEQRRDFASKVFAIQKAYNLVKDIEFDFIGILDADITFQPNYYESILHEFDQNERLGIAGGGFYDVFENKRIKIPFSPYIVRGAVQLFRKLCFNDVGGFLPLKWGGEDTIACTIARMKGWEIQTFESIIVLHHRKTGSVGENILQINYHLGKRDYHRGLITLAQFLKSLSRITDNPFLLGGLSQIAGYWSCKLKKEKLILDDQTLNYIKQEQIIRIKKIFGLS